MQSKYGKCRYKLKKNPLCPLMDLNHKYLVYFKYPLNVYITLVVCFALWLYSFMRHRIKGRAANNSYINDQFICVKNGLVFD